INGARLALSSAAEQGLNGTAADAFLQLADDSTYVGVLAYLPPDAAPFDAALHEFRQAIATATGCPTMFGFGPRYLHSTGQLHKGGDNNGVFIILTAPARDDLAIPNAPYSFGVLEEAQALGDFLSLDKTGRRALLLQLPTRDP